MVKERTAQRYEVEWCSSIPSDENGDAIMDGAVDERRYFRSFDEAKRFAWQVLRDGAGKLPWEMVRIALQERQLDAGIWECERSKVYRWEKVEQWETCEDGEEPYKM